MNRYCYITITVIKYKIYYCDEVLYIFLAVPHPVPTESRQDQSSNQEEGPRHRASDGEGPRETFRGRESRRSGGGPQGGGAGVEVEGRWR